MCQQRDFYDGVFVSIVILRPTHKIKASQQAFSHAGLTAVGVALQTLLPADDIGYIVQSANIGQAKHIIFTSQRAACLSLPFIPELPSQTYLYAVGPSTFETIAQWTNQHPFWCNNHQIMLPDVRHFTSEGLLALAPLQKARLCSENPENIVIVKGLNGRSTLHETLLERGANVIECAVYSRENLPVPEATHSWVMADIKTMVTTSSEQLQQAFKVFPKAWLISLQWVVVSERTALAAKQLGITKIYIANGASDAALIEKVQSI
nr:uroporphyrinogen-III synthase [Opacimonas viscosa]